MKQRVMIGAGEDSPTVTKMVVSPSGSERMEMKAV